MDISFHRGPTGEPGGGHIYLLLLKVNEVGLWKRSSPCCGSSMRGT
jgi:hypothetical protein